MKLIRIGAFVCSFTLFVFVLSCVMFPAMAWQKVKEKLGRQNARHTRRMITRLQVKWGSWLFWQVHRIMGIELDLDLHGWKDDLGPYLVVMNHTGMFDVVTVLWVLSVYGRFDLRWVVKRQMARAPLIGRMAKWSGNAFVARSGDPNDKDAVTKCAELASDDDSSILIFPEGTRNPYNLLTPKYGGFMRMREALPHYRVLSITVAWFPVREGAGGKTLTEGADLFGKTLFISARLVPTQELRDPKWLDAEWHHKQVLIETWRKRTMLRALISGDHLPR